MQIHIDCVVVLMKTRFRDMRLQFIVDDGVWLLRMNSSPPHHPLRAAATTTTSARVTCPGPGGGGKRSLKVNRVVLALFKFMC